MGKEKGKCFSKTNMGQRIESDHYQTPYSITRQFLDVAYRELASRLKVPVPEACKLTPGMCGKSMMVWIQ